MDSILKYVWCSEDDTRELEQLIRDVGEVEVITVPRYERMQATEAVAKVECALGEL